MPSARWMQSTRVEGSASLVEDRELCRELSLRDDAPSTSRLGADGAGESVSISPPASTQVAEMRGVLMDGMNSSEEVFGSDQAFDWLVEPWGKLTNDADGAVEPLGSGAEACCQCNTSVDSDRKPIASGPAWAAEAFEPMNHDSVQQVSMTFERAAPYPVLQSMYNTR